MIKLLVNFRKDGKEYKKGQKIDLSLKEEQEFIKAGYAEIAEVEKVEVLEGEIKTPGPELIIPPGEKEEEDYEEIKLTYEELDKKTIAELEEIAAENNIELTEVKKKDKILELINKLTTSEEI